MKKDKEGKGNSDDLRNRLDSLPSTTLRKGLSK